MDIHHSLSELGESRLEGLELAPAQNQVQVDFIGLDFSPGVRLRYQYRLKDADPEWVALFQEIMRARIPTK